MLVPTNDPALIVQWLVHSLIIVIVCRPGSYVPAEPGSRFPLMIVVGAAIGGVVFLILLITLLVVLIKRCRRAPPVKKSSERSNSFRVSMEKNLL